MPYAHNKGADQPAHLHNLISNFVIHSLGNIKSIDFISLYLKFQLLQASVAQQTGTSLAARKTLMTGFSRGGSYLPDSLIQFIHA